MIKHLNLCFSNKCSANCIFCPEKRGNGHDFMTLDILRSILKWASQFKIEQIVVGENGDLFLNKNAYTMMRLIRKSFPKAKIIMFTNFLTFKDSVSVVSEKLVDEIVCNIDSMNPDIYYNAKKAVFSQAYTNLHFFLDNRRRFNNPIPLQIMLLNPTYYSHLFENIFGKKTSKWCELTIDDSMKSANSLLCLLEGFDSVQILNPCFWAERDNIRGDKIPEKLKPFKYCPMIERIKNEAFIAPNGDWYACCLDAKQELVIGNVLKQSNEELEKCRYNLLCLLYDKKFGDIGSPCDTVVCCHNYKFVEGEKNEL